MRLVADLNIVITLVPPNNTQAQKELQTLKSELVVFLSAFMTDKVRLSSSSSSRCFF
jgi:hypothetical protein